jgi:hypothetical protein
MRAVFSRNLAENFAKFGRRSLYVETGIVMEDAGRWIEFYEPEIDGD